MFLTLPIQPIEEFLARNDNSFADLKRREICTVGEFVSSGSGNAKDGSNVRQVHHQWQFFQRVILFLVHFGFLSPILGIEIGL